METEKTQTDSTYLGHSQHKPGEEKNVKKKSGRDGADVPLERTSNLWCEDDCVAIMNSGWCTHLVDKDVEKAQGTSQAAISPLHQEQQKMCCWNI
jgi:hypothetical protein